MRQTPTGRGRDVPGLVERLAKAEKAIEQLYRRLNRQPKIPKQEAAGGIIGQVDVWADNNTVTATAGQNNINFGAITYGNTVPITEAHPNPTDAWSTWLTISGHELTLAPGWYDVALYVRLSFASQSAAPAAFASFMTGLGIDNAHNGYDTSAATPLGSTAWGVERILSTGPVYAAPGYGTFWAECRPLPGSFPGSNTASLSGLIWTITRYG